MMALPSSPVGMASSSPGRSCIREAPSDARYSTKQHERRRGAYERKRDRSEVMGHGAGINFSADSSFLPQLEGTSSFLPQPGSGTPPPTSVDGQLDWGELIQEDDAIPPPPPPIRQESSGCSSPLQTKSRRTSCADVKASIHKVRSSPSLLMQFEEALTKEEEEVVVESREQHVASVEYADSIGGGYSVGCAPVPVGRTETEVCPGTAKTPPSISRRPSMMNRVHSMPALAQQAAKTDTCTQGNASTATNATCTSTDEQRTDLFIDPFANTNPEGFMRTIVESHGYDSTPIDALSVTNFFLEHTPEQIEAYDNEVTGAVRSDDLDALRVMLRAGRPLQCSNRFGESIVHMACRNGSLGVVRFLVEEADVTIRVRDDVGRTPLHDACWSSSPSFELIRMLIERDPDLLLLSDKRGHTPLAYVRRNDWGEWCRFLDTIRDRLVPREVVEPKVTF